jgi:hypothetical protein
MTVAEAKMMEAIATYLPKIAKALEKANKLKEFELRADIGDKCSLNAYKHQELDQLIKE